MGKKTAVLLFLLLFSAVAVSESSGFPFTLKITSLPDEVEAGKTFGFGFTVQNKGSEGTDVQLEYWVGRDDKKILGGKDTVFVGAGEAKDMQAGLTLFSDMGGKYFFYIQLNYNGEEIASYRPIEVQKGTPLVMRLDLGEIGSVPENQQFSFTVSSEFNKEARESVEFNEEISLGGRTVWEKRRTISIATQASFAENVEGLPPGRYTLSVTAFYGRNFVKELKEFEVKAAAAAETQQSMLQSYLNSAIVLIALVIIALIIAVNMIHVRIKQIGPPKEEPPKRRKKLKNVYHATTIIIILSMGLVVVLGGAYLLLGPASVDAAVGGEWLALEKTGLVLQAHLPVLQQRGFEAMLWAYESGTMQHYIGSGLAVVGAVAAWLIIRKINGRNAPEE